MKLFGNSRKSKHSGKTAASYVEETVVDFEEEINETEPVDPGRQHNTGASEEDVTRISNEEYEDFEEEPAKKRSLTGLQKGLIILGAVLAVLVILVVIIWKSFVKLPEIETPPITTQVTTPEPTPQNTGGIQSIETAPSTPELDVKVTSVQVNPVQDEAEVGDNLGELLTVPGDRKEGWYTVLLVGVDKGSYLTDTMMLCSLDTVNHDLKIASIPRDTFINSKAAGYKLNTAYTAGYNKGGTQEAGMEELMKQVSLLVGFVPDAYCMINLEAFVQIVDIIGGVEFDVPRDMYYSDPTQDLLIDLKKGVQVLDGDKAMQLVRFRKGYDAQDLTRMEVQQDFIKAMAKQVLTVKNTLKVPDICETVFENMYTNLTVGNIIAFAQELLKVDLDSIETMTMINEDGGWNGLSYVFLYGYDMVDTVNEWFNPYEEDLTIDDVYIYTLENGIISRSLRSTTYNSHAYSNYGTASPDAVHAEEPKGPEVNITQGEDVADVD